MTCMYSLYPTILFITRNEKMMNLCWPADFTASAYGQGFVMNKLITLVLLISVEVSQAQVCYMFDFVLF